MGLQDSDVIWIMQWGNAATVLGTSPHAVNLILYLTPWIQECKGCVYIAELAIDSLIRFFLIHANTTKHYNGLKSALDSS